VIVTSKDRAALLSLALRSVQLQDFLRWECVVVDDHSLDDSLEVAQRFATLDARFRVVQHASSRGPSAARNTGLALARADLVCFLDDDDVLMSRSLSSRVLSIAGQPENVAGSYCDWVGIAPDARLQACRGATRAAAARSGISFGDLASGNPFILSSPLVRADVIRSAGGFDEALRHAEDADLWFKILRRGYRFVYSPVVGVGYRRSPGSLVLGDPLVLIGRSSGDPTRRQFRESTPDR
jgi:glycosyltransferase involved in cell wall biosynthesis